MELSQHLFDLQMARYMRRAGEDQPGTVPEAHAMPENPVHIAARPRNATDTTDQPNPLAERIDQVLERLTQLVEHAYRPEEPDRQAERFNQLFERFDKLLEQSNQSTNKANHLAEKSNQLAESANKLARQLNQALERSNQLAENAFKPVEKLEDVLRNINRVLVGIQHAIVRNRKGNTASAVDCLVNEKGETPIVSETTGHSSFIEVSESHRCYVSDYLPVTIDGVVPKGLYAPGWWVGRLLCFYGIGKGMNMSETSTILKAGKDKEA
ncbi:hypothetical protein FRC11_012062, partial [Ceratobasidium sp. 423]